MREYTFLDFFKSLLVANKGRRIWKKYNKRYDIEARGDYLVLLPSCEDEYNRHFFNYIDKCFEPRKRIVILAADPKIEKIAPLYERRNELIVCHIAPKEIEELIAYYAFKPFYFRFYLISLDEPCERKCSHLIGKKGITAEELIAVGIMGYDSEKYQKGSCVIRVPEYEGSDEEVVGFLRNCVVRETMNAKKVVS